MGELRVTGCPLVNPERCSTPAAHPVEVIEALHEASSLRAVGRWRVVDGHLICRPHLRTCDANSDASRHSVNHFVRDHNAFSGGVICRYYSSNLQAHGTSPHAVRLAGAVCYSETMYARLLPTPRERSGDWLKLNAK